jgi:hypothetical protein
VLLRSILSDRMSFVLNWISLALGAGALDALKKDFSYCYVCSQLCGSLLIKKLHRQKDRVERDASFFALCLTIFLILIYS